MRISLRPKYIYILQETMAFSILIKVVNQPASLITYNQKERLARMPNERFLKPVPKILDAACAHRYVNTVSEAEGGCKLLPLLPLTAASSRLMNCTVLRLRRQPGRLGLLLLRDAVTMCGYYVLHLFAAHRFKKIYIQCSKNKKNTTTYLK